MTVLIHVSRNVHRSLSALVALTPFVFSGVCCVLGVLFEIHEERRVLSAPLIVFVPACGWLGMLLLPVARLHPSIRNLSEKGVSAERNR
jgi:hypothetical protein